VQESAERLQQLEWKSQELDRRVVEKRTNLETYIEGSDEALQRDFDGFDASVRQREEQLDNLQSEFENLNLDLTNLRANTDGLNNKKGKATVLQEQVGTLKEQQCQLGASLQRKHSITATLSSTWNASESQNAAGAFLQNLQNEVRMIV
jgi:chromosome segregation ATPase